MNRLGFRFGDGEGGRDGIVASGERSVGELDATVDCVSADADGDVFLRLQSADGADTVKVTAQLDADLARTLAAALGNAADEAEYADLGVSAKSD